MNQPLTDTSVTRNIEFGYLPPAEPLTLEEILSDPWLRLNNLYWIVDKRGKKIKFHCNREQYEFYQDMWYLNIVLKARQLGMTTLIQLFMLDRCLFNPNITAGVIAHTKDDAKKFFDNKIKFAYDNLPAEIRDRAKSKNDNVNELKFANNSAINVGTSFRSGTCQYLHISEFGKICAKRPEIAKEIVAGALNTVAPGQFIFIESTAEGAHGRFYDMTQRAEKAQLAGEELTQMDYEFFFFAWWRSHEYRLNAHVDFDEELQEYFDDINAELRERYGTELDHEQMCWYAKKQNEQGEVLMKQEYPSTPEEAFRGITEGAIWGKQMRAARQTKRIARLPIVPNIPVNTFWDLGRNDTTAIWFHQRVGTENRFIDYYENEQQPIHHYVEVLKNEKDYVYGEHYLPHDANVTELTQGDNMTRQEVIESLGLKPTRVVERIGHINEGIEMTRQALPSCWFDMIRCEAGIKALEAYRYEFNEKMERWGTLPLHNWASNAADAFRQFAQGYRHRAHYDGPNADHPLSRAARQRRRKVKNETSWRV